MESVSMKKMWDSIWKHKKIIIIFVLLCLAAGVGLGVKKARSVSSASELQEIEDYKSGLDKYKDVMDNILANMSTTQEQIDNLQKYCDSSIYMNIDPLNVNVASVQYRILMSDGSDTQGNSSVANEKSADIMNELTAYVKNGDWKVAAEEELSDVPVEYLSEVVGSTSTGNIFTLTVMHYDADQAAKICKVVDEQIQKYAASTLKENGEFSFSTIMSNQTVMALPEVQSTQNSYLTSLQNYKDSLSELKKNELSQQVSEKTYRKDYKPDSMDAPSAKKVLVQYAALGIIAGLVISCALLALLYVLSDKLKGKENIKAAGITVLGNYSAKEGYRPALEREMIDFDLIRKERSVEQVFFGMLSDAEIVQKAVQEYQAAMEKKSLAVEVGSNIENDSEMMKRFVEIGNCILFVEVGKTTYTQIKAYLEICKKFNVSVLGCVVVE
ncbi:hypothetical protein DXB15_08610 [Roseburia sp. OM02-15]|nr:hypothetical protein DXB15_08610 [Roseburia sp. OM02-15]